MTRISEKTMVPLGAVFVFFVTLSGGAFWLQEMYALASTNRDQLAQIKQDLAEIQESRTYYRSRLWEAIRSQDKRLARIEGKLDVVIGKQ